MGGDKLTGLAIGIVVTAAFVLLPALIVPVFYLAANVYAWIKWSAFDSDSITVGALLTILVLTVALFALLAAGAVALIGRALSPKNRED